MDYKKMDLDCLLEIRPLLTTYATGSCDCTPGGLWQWREFFDTRIALVKDTLFGKMRYYDGTLRHLFPLGPDAQSALKRLEEEEGGELLFAAVTPEQLKVLMRVFGSRARASFERNICDYLYDPQTLSEFRGKRLSGQRNHVNAFFKEHTERVEVLCDANRRSACAFLREHFAPSEADTPLKYAEAQSAAELLSVCDSLGLLTLLLYADDELVALSIGEVCGDTLFVHVEKALRTCRGASQRIASLFAARYGEKCRFVNREEDDGNAGLREAKLRLHPECLLKKYTVRVARA